MRPEISVTVSGLGFLYPDDLAGVVELAELADAHGVDQLMIPDHVLMGPHPEKYPYGPFPLPPEEPWLEPLVALAAMAGASERVRLGTGVLITPLRPPALLAKMVATLDVLSRGRLDLGVGVGWQAEEYAAEGIDFEARWRLFEEGLRACKVLWRDAPAAFRGEHVAFESVYSLPRPAQEGGPPIWFGTGLGPHNLRRIVELADGWMPMDSSPASLTAGIERLRAAFSDAGRSFEGFGVRAHTPAVFEGRRVDL
ncbi:MAG: TIGR03619 family F420-dependent LLM class oxidoreductase, partial [Proteobacteria bacterium]|nr:TIGR03619 family F420-dependent LLM class oxidoreductase [Pseudomonadota bacterium]